MIPNYLFLGLSPPPPDGGLFFVFSTPPEKAGFCRERKKTQGVDSVSP